MSIINQCVQMREDKFKPTIILSFVYTDTGIRIVESVDVLNVRQSD